MGDMATDAGTIRINMDFVAFAKLYEGKIFSKKDAKTINKLVEAARALLDRIEKTMRPEYMRGLKATTRRKFLNSLKELERAKKKFAVSEHNLDELKEYVPQNLIPVTVLIDQSISKLYKQKRSERILKRKKRK
jgi:ABC-type Na+ transport system ATPase subunit NatA